jgi:hypothetical protein
VEGAIFVPSGLVITYLCRQFDDRHEPAICAAEAASFILTKPLDWVATWTVYWAYCSDQPSTGAYEGSMRVYLAAIEALKR